MSQKEIDRLKARAKKLEKGKVFGCGCQFCGEREYWAAQFRAEAARLEALLADSLVTDTGRTEKQAREGRS